MRCSMNGAKRFPMVRFHNSTGRTTEGFYDTASLRSQKSSQHKIVYQKENALPKRRCPRRCKPERDNGANEPCKPNDAPKTKPRPCVKTMLADTRLRLSLHWFAREGVRQVARGRTVTLIETQFDRTVGTGQSPTWQAIPFDVCAARQRQFHTTVRDVT